MRRVVNANFRLGREEYAVRLGNIATDKSLPEDPLGSTGISGPMAYPIGRDRITGIWQPLSSYRSAEDARRVVQSVLSGPSQTASPDWVAAMIEAVASLKLETEPIGCCRGFARRPWETALKQPPCGHWLASLMPLAWQKLWPLDWKRGKGGCAVKPSSGRNNRLIV